ncbi:unnamed protein product, partial [Ectocarpus sp. 12 AP-2014]
PQRPTSPTIPTSPFATRKNFHRRQNPSRQGQIERRGGNSHATTDHPCRDSRGRFVLQSMGLPRRKRWCG